MRYILAACVLAQLTAWGLGYKLASDDAAHAMQAATDKRAAILAQIEKE